eukprot:TRINITY_DN15150_c0_g1_i1.p2 TRINITY_DN15150_c0_g1~~TRINITY_DN15150_c0_g1_i1.p2  ORF type:complete len:121 (+),score=24.54 TRINITY_DN15150_c0_g1_i1:843-1205(+)
MSDRAFGTSFQFDNKGTHTPLEFFDALYFVIVTFSTVGYGDIVPLGTSARLICCVFIVGAFAIVPRKVNALADALSKQSPYLGVYQGNPRQTVSYTHLRAHETPEHLVCRLLLEKKKKIN